MATESRSRKHDDSTGLILLIGGGVGLYLVLRSREQPRKPLPGSAVPGSGTGEPLRNREPGQVARVHTPLPPSIGVELMRLLTVSELGREYTNESGLMLAAHSALETNEWQSMYNNNMGNITTTPDRPYYLNPPDDTKHKYLDERSPEEGGQALVRLVLRKYQPAVYYAKVGNPELYARELKKGGYYEADERAYAKRLRQLYNKYVATYGWKPV